MFSSFTVFGREISMYMIMAVLGAVAAGVVFFLNARGPEYRRDQLLHIVVVGAGGALVGAHILFFLTRLDFLAAVIANPGAYIKSFRTFLSVLASLFGGMVYYGGLFGAVFAIRLYCKKLKIDFAPHSDALTPGVPLFHTFGRVGCLFAGCCYGFECSYGWRFPDSQSADPAKRYFPIQAVEAGCNLLIFLLLEFVLRGRVRRGSLIWWYGLLYSAVRFVLEFFRGDGVRGVFAGLSTSQWVGIGVFVLSAAMLLRVRFSKKKDDNDGQEV